MKTIIKNILRFFKIEYSVRDQLANPNNWILENERDESYEYDQYTRPPQRHYRHKTFKDFWINESYIGSPRDKERVIELFIESYDNNDLIEDTFLYISWGVK